MELLRESTKSERNNDDDGDDDILNKITTIKLSEQKIHKEEKSEHETKKIVEITEDKEEEKEEELKSLPILRINLSKLCGYIPKTKEEYNVLCDEIKIALFGKDDDSISIEFYKRSSELLESNIAIHSDTTVKNNATATTTTTTTATVNNNDEDDKSWFSISYPEYITIFDKENDTPCNVIRVSSVWNQILNEINNNNNNSETNSTTTPVPVVHRIISHIPNVTNQPLLWKLDMIHYIQTLAQNEQEHKTEKIKKEDLIAWRTTQRSTKMNKLNEIKTIFEERFMETERELEGHVDAREAKVEQQMDDLFGITIQFPEESSSSEEEPEVDTDDSDSDASIHSESSIKKQRRLKRRAKILKRRIEKQKQNERDVKKEELNNQYRTMTENKLQLMLQSYTTQLNKMDDLLDALLTEEEEEMDGDDDCILLEEEMEQPQDGCNDDNSSTAGKLTLLDEILAMILGSLPKHNPNQNEHEFIKQTYQEHEEIKLQWLEYFGRLPVSITNHMDNTTKKEEEEEEITSLLELNKEDETPDCWEDEVDDIVQDLSVLGMDASSSNKKESSNIEKPMMGFRPGGKLPTKL